MRSRREQLQAHRFLTRRIVSAVLAGEPESAEQPMRRFSGAAFASVMIGAVVVAGFGVYGQLKPVGNKSWQAENALIIEEETGARYIFRGGKLVPVTNYASALLLTGSVAPKSQTVSAASLEGVPREVPYGIVGAPDSLPDPTRLLGLPWRVCTYRAQKDVPGVMAAALVLGDEAAGGTDPGAKAVLAKDPSGTKHLLWQGRRYELPNPSSESALGLAGKPVADVSTAFVNAIPAGPPLVFPITDVGRPARSVLGKARKVGELFSLEQAGGTGYYVMLADGLAPLTEVGLSLVKPQIAAVFGREPKVTAISAGDVGALAPSGVEGLPATVPQLVQPDGDDPAMCVTHRGASGQGGAALRLLPALPSVVAGRRSSSGARGDVVDAVVVPGGRGALVRSPSRALFLVTDQGRRFGVPTNAAQAALGYGHVKPVDVPSELLALIPTGPALDPDAARRPVS